MRDHSSTNQTTQLVETHAALDPRIRFFYIPLGMLLLFLTGGMVYRQLIRSDQYSEREKQQNQRRILVPGPRGNIYDREGRLMVGNRARFALTLHLDELRREFAKEYLRIRDNYRQSGDSHIPETSELEEIARYSVVQNYMDRANRIIGRQDSVSAKTLEQHYKQQRLIPYILIEDLSPEEYAKLLEQLPVNSPLQLYASSIRYYPYGATAAHVLGFVSSEDEIEAPEDLPGADLTTFKMKGSTGRNGLEREYDETLQGQAGGSIYLVDPAGYRILPPLIQQKPVQGQSITCSIDLDLQQAAESAIIQQGFNGTAVALDVQTGEVLTMASIPSYNLSDFTPSLSQAYAKEIMDQGAWLNRALNGLYPPGSTFKLITAIAGLRNHAITPQTQVECTGTFRVGGRTFVCNNHRDRGPVDLQHAIEKSCNTFFYYTGIQTGIDHLSAEAKRFGLDHPTGIELPFETKRMIIPDPEWKKDRNGLSWFPGDTANTAIGQGDVLVTPLQMACVITSIARRETKTVPHIIHEDKRPPQHGPDIDISDENWQGLLSGMRAVPLTGTGRLLSLPRYAIPGLTIAGKTGTAQKRTPKGTLNFAWFVCFAPAEHPRIAMAIMLEGDTPGEDTGGGHYATPVASAILKVWQQKYGDSTISSGQP